MGVMLMMGCVILVLAIIVILLFRFCKPGNKCHTIGRKIKQKIFWNTVLRFVLQSYLKNSLAVLFTISVMNVSTSTGIMNAVASIVLLLVLIVLPIYFAILLHRKRQSLTLEEMKAKIGSLYLGMNVKTVYQRLYSSIFMLRRLLYAILTVSCIDNPNILIHVFLMSNIMYIAFTGYVGPNDTKLARRMEYLNESFLQMTTYHLALFPLSPTLADEELAGWSMVGFICAVFLCNLVVMLVLSVCGLRRKLYLRKLKKK